MLSMRRLNNKTASTSDMNMHERMSAKSVCCPAKRVTDRYVRVASDTMSQAQSAIPAKMMTRGVRSSHSPRRSQKAIGTTATQTAQSSASTNDFRAARGSATSRRTWDWIASPPTVRPSRAARLPL